MSVLHRNRVPTPLSPPSKCVTPLDPNGGGKHLLAGEGVGGTHFGRLDRKPDTLYTLCPVTSVRQLETTQKPQRVSKYMYMEVCGEVGVQ